MFGKYHTLPNFPATLEFSYFSQLFLFGVPESNVVFSQFPFEIFIDLLVEFTIFKFHARRGISKYAIRFLHIYRNLYSINTAKRGEKLYGETYSNAHLSVRSRD